MKRKKTTKRKKNNQHYSPQVLALVLLIAVFFEGAMFGVTTGPDLKKSMEVLDISAYIVQTKSQIAEFAEPMVNVVLSVHKFYQSAAAVTAALLQDNIIDNTVLIIQGINEFYVQASKELASALDLSDTLLPQAVAAY